MWKLSKQNKAALIDEYLSSSVNCADLGRRYGISREAVRKLLHNRGITVSPNRPRICTQIEQYPDYEVIQIKRKS